VIRCMTLHQPWASLVAEGIKTIETRGRAHPWRSAIGERIGIHAAIGERWSPGRRFGDWSAYRTDEHDGPRLTRSNPDYRVEGGDRPDQSLLHIPLPLGAIVATCILSDVVPMIEEQTGPRCVEPHFSLEDGYLFPAALPDLGWYPEGDEPVSMWDQFPYGDFGPGRWALILTDISKLDTPIPARGLQGLWKFDDINRLGPMLMTPERRAVIDGAH